MPEVSAEIARIRGMDDPPAMLRAYGALEAGLRAENRTLAAEAVSAVLAAILAAADKQRGRTTGADDAPAVPAELAEERRRREAAELDAAHTARALAIVLRTGRWRWRCRRWLLGDVRAEMALPEELRQEGISYPRRGRWPEAAGAVLALVAVAVWGGMWGSGGAPERKAQEISALSGKAGVP